jgi:hypothetical protein
MWTGVDYAPTEANHAATRELNQATEMDNVSTQGTYAPAQLNQSCDCGGCCVAEADTLSPEGMNQATIAIIASP